MDDCADGVAVGFYADETDAEPAVAGGDVIAIEICGAAVGGDEDIEVAIAVEVADGETASYFGACEGLPDLTGRVAEFCVALIEEEMRGLRISAAEVADGVVDVSVDSEQVKAAIKIGIEENTTEAETVARGGDRCLEFNATSV